MLEKLNHINWTNLRELVDENDIFCGRITGIERYGLFVELTPGITGLLHMHNYHAFFDPEKHMRGEYVWCQILELREADEQIDLERVAFTSDNYFHDVYLYLKENYLPGDYMRGLVAELTNWGAWAEVFPGFRTSMTRADNPVLGTNEARTMEQTAQWIEFVEFDDEKERITTRLLDPELRERQGTQIVSMPDRSYGMYQAPSPAAIRDPGDPITIERAEDGALPPLPESVRDASLPLSVVDIFLGMAEDDLTPEEAIDRLDASYKAEKEAYRLNLSTSKRRFSYETGLRKPNGAMISAGFVPDRRDPDRWVMNFVGTDSANIKNTIDQFAYVPDWHTALQELAAMCLPGDIWSFDPNYQDFFILEQYLNFTFYRLRDEGKVVESDDGTLAVLNTGLVNIFFSDIIMAFSRVEPSDLTNHRRWQFLGFTIWGEGQLGKSLYAGFIDHPERAKYWSTADELIYDTTKSLNCDQEHILRDNLPRLPLLFLREQMRHSDEVHLAKAFEIIRFSDNHREKSQAWSTVHSYILNDPLILRRLQHRLEEGINLAVKRCEWNYKTAVPIFYPRGNSLSLLLPLALTTDGQEADLALVVEQLPSGHYQGQTILTLEQAYLDARLITRPEGGWLAAEAVFKMPAEDDHRPPQEDDYDDNYDDNYEHSDDYSSAASESEEEFDEDFEEEGDDYEYDYDEEYDDDYDEDDYDYEDEDEDDFDEDFVEYDDDTDVR